MTQGLGKMLTGEGLLSRKDGSKATLRIQDPVDSRRQLTQLEFLMLPTEVASLYSSCPASVYVSYYINPGLAHPVIF